MSEEKPKLAIYARQSETEREYWIEKLSRISGDSNLILDYERPKSYSGQKDSVRVTLTDKVYAELIRLTNDSSFLIYTALQAALKICLHKYTSRTPIVVGSPSRQTNDGSVQPPNALPIVDDLSGHLSVRELLLNVRQTLLEAYSKQGYPFDSLIRDLGYAHVDNRCALFDIAVTLKDIHYPLPRVKNDITIKFSRADKRIAGEIEFNTKVFAKQTIECFAKHFVWVLQQALENTSALISELQICTPAERHELLVTWNDTRRDYREDQYVHELFEKQVERTPHAVAVEFEAEHLTYGELNRRANQLAQYLQRHGVEPGVLVGIGVERSMEMVVGLLGILKAGGAYLPLDPVYPKKRLAFMLEHAEVPVLLTQKGLLKGVAGDGITVLCLDEWKANGESDRNPINRAKPEDLAYVVYTSGSTGMPKGVMIHHGGLAHRVLSMAEIYRLDQTHRLLQFVSLSFDAFAEEIFPSLASGATLVLHPNPGSIPPGELMAECKRLGITTLHIPPAYWHRVVDESSSSQQPVPECLKLVITGGESPSLNSLLKWSRLNSVQSRFINAYGPTEATITSTFYEAPTDHERVRNLSRVPIGRPIANTQIYILDHDGLPVPVGVPGELYIGGDGLARGYHKRADQTADSFVPNPFSQTPGARLYKTGDQARYLSDGNIEFLGRLDHQIKIRSYRIEPAEIESVLAGHQSVSEAIVLAREDRFGDQRLIAYLVPESGQVPTVDGLHKHLKDRLPEYMMPSAFMLLDELPLSPNGKVDRNALPTPDDSTDEEKDSFRAPRTRVEEVLAGIWAEVLEVKQVGIDDNFFDLGGHSLLATQLISRIRDALGVEVPLRSLFESPTIAGLAEEIAAAIVEHHRQPPSITPVSRDLELTLSFAQQRLWLIDQLEPGNPAYNIPVAMRLEGRLNVEALEQTLTELVRRHEVLRTTFPAVEGRPVQIIRRSDPFRLAVTDLSKLTREQREAEARRLATEEARRSFDLTLGPLMRVTLILFSEQEYGLLLTIHHIVSDGWSVGVLINEVAKLYEAFSAGRPSPLAELPIQYADFAHWQRQWLQGEVLEGQLRYWQKQLAGLTVLELPADRPRPATQTYRGEHQSFTLSKAISEALKELSHTEGVTLFMTLLATFQVLLYRYTGQEDIAVGTDISGRNRVEAEGLIGFFVNQLVMRTDLSGNPTFRELLGRVREIALGAFANQDLPFEKLVEDLQPERDLSHTPLFQVTFILQTPPRAGLSLPGLTLSKLAFENETAKFDLALSMVETEQGLAGSFEYSADIFDRARIRRMAEHFATLMEAIAANPDQHIRKLPVLTDAERHRLLVEWNSTRTEYPLNQCFHQLFEAQVERTPDTIAAVANGERLTYSELNRRANRMARLLVEEGVGPDFIVALLGRRGFNLLTTVLAVFKAGGAYLPLDPSYPAHRLLQVLKQSGASLVIAESEFMSTVADAIVSASAKRPRILQMEELLQQERAEENLPLRCSPNHLAYVIYTSGSTGVPKGAMVEHIGMVNHLFAKISELELRDADRVAQTASQCFDISIWQFLAALSRGGEVHIVDDDVASDPSRLLHDVRRDRISIVEIVPSLLRAILEQIADRESDRPVLPALRWLVLTGEPLPPELCRQWMSYYPDVLLLNAYGPTECSDDVSHYRIPKPMPAGVTRTSIGRPIANTQLYVLNADLDPVPTGVVGELYVGGIGVGRGYLRDASRTAEVFLPDPFACELGRRLYRTGDRARYLADGNIEFLGRIDHQVKIRGFRIELGEIETLLMMHPEVRECVVMARDDVPGGKTLVAYVVLHEENAGSINSLRIFLKEKLPDYVLPSKFVTLDEIPLTPNGKIDRKSLPAPDPAQPAFEESVLSSRTLVEEVLAEIWAKTLGLEQAGIHTDFFEAGGHSLLGAQVIARVRDTFNVDLPLRSLFEVPTVAGLAQRIEIAMRNGQGIQAPPIQRVSRDRELPLSFAQQRLWFLEQLQPDEHLYNIQAAVRIKGPLKIDTLERTLNEVFRRHENLRTTFPAMKGRPVQVITPASPFKLPVLDVSDLPEPKRESEVRRLALEEVQRPFDLSRGPLVRIRLFRLDGEEHIVLFAMHHIVFDGWSIGVLIREVTLLYQAFSEGRPSPLLDLPVQYADFACWQREWLQGEVLEEQLRYWKKQLAGLPPLELPTDRPRRAALSHRGGRHSFRLSKSLTDSLKKLSRREGVTVFMTLLAAFQALLYRYTGQEQISVGTDMANRNRVETAGLIGFFINMMVLRTDLSGGQSFRQLLSQVREVALGAYAHQDLPFDKVVEELQPERDLSHSPLFRVVFVFQNTPIQPLELPELRLTPLDLNYDTVRFDLTLWMEEEVAGLHGSWGYSTDLFDADTIERMSANFETMLDSVVAQPEAPLDSLEMLSPSERAKIALEEQSREDSKYKKLINITPKAIRVKGDH
jgi:amino acid adenylation domain-containing protein